MIRTALATLTAAAALALPAALIIGGSASADPTQKQDAERAALIALAAERSGGSGAVAGCVLPATGLTPSTLSLPADSIDIARRVIATATKPGGVGVQGAVDQITAGLVESWDPATQSGLHNLTYGDADSLGPWQMRPSQGWGTRAQVLNLDYSVPKWQAVLTTIPGWQSMDPATAAQAVERSGYPGRYAAKVDQAKQIVAALSGTAATVCQGSTATTAPVTGKIAQVLTWANSQVGGAYVWGGTGYAGGGKGGYDCSGFTQHAFGLIGITLPRTAEDQRQWLMAGHGTLVARGHEQAGDLIFWDSPDAAPTEAGHVTIVNNPATQQTVEAMDTADGIVNGNYARCYTYHAQPGHFCQVWHVTGT